MSKIGILGIGTWGIALARMLSNTGHEVLAWSPSSIRVDELTSTRRHKNLPNINIPDSICFTNDISIVAKSKDIIISAVPSIAMRNTMSQAKTHIQDGQVIVNVAKGIELDTLYTMTQVIKDIIPEANTVTLSGPTHAEEVAKDIPTAVISACKDIEIATFTRNIFMNENMYVYTSIDVLGVEIAGSLKNIIALACGICMGMGMGDNTRATIITKGIAEILELGLKMGCKAETFYGLAGLGDLIVTAMSKYSRNYKCGFFIGTGKTSTEAVKEVGMIVEGINAIPVAMSLMKKYKTTMPIIMAVNEVVNNGSDPKAIVRALT